MPNGEQTKDSDLHLTWQERELLMELVQQELKHLANSDWPIDQARRLEWRVGKLEGLRAKLEVLT